MPMQGSSKSSHCVDIPLPADTALTIPNEKRWHAPTEKKRFVGALTTGVPCILETCVGLKAALGEPACLRVAKPTRSSARDITLALPTKLCCVTRRRAPFHVDRSLVTCNRCRRCRRDINGHTIYMYTGMGFCSRACRYEYHVDEVEYKKRLAAALMERSKRIVTRIMAASKANKLATERPTFFTCAEADE